MAAMWTAVVLALAAMTASTAELIVSAAENNGWKLVDMHYQPNWFDGDQLPAIVSDLVEKLSETDTNDDAEDADLDIQYQEWQDESLSDTTDEDGDDKD